MRSVALWDEVKDSLTKRGTFLSGGQQQRLCIARSLALKPDVLLMDEPTSALDPIATKYIEELMDGLKKDVTILIVTHNMSQAMRISDYSMFMYMGELIEYDRTDKMFDNPTDERTRAYLTGKWDKVIFVTILGTPEQMGKMDVFPFAPECFLRNCNKQAKWFVY